MNPRRSPRSLLLLLLPSLAACVSEGAPDGAFDDEPMAGSLSFPTGALVVNECMSGTSGWMELYNKSAAAIDLAADPATCFYVDDGAGGGAPKRIADTNVSHVAGSTTCSAAGRSATCGLVAPGERVWIGYAYVNSVTADTCRLVSAPLTAGTCGATQTDLAAGGPTASTVMGQCFGRQPDGQAWSASAIACTQGASNGGCTAGTPCDDGNACTTGEALLADCTCVGGSATSCDDGNPCTADSCAIVAGCSATPLGDGTVCGQGAICEAGACVPDTGSGGAGGSGGQGGEGGTGGGCGDPLDPAVILATGAPDKRLLHGMIVTPDQAFMGDVLIVGDTIACVAPSCAGAPEAANATVVDTHGIILPGLVDVHNHILFDIFDENDWSPPQVYTNHNQWVNDPRYDAMLDAKQYLNSEGGSPVELSCELDKYGELKSLVGGSTTIVGHTGINRTCYGSLARTAEQPSNGLGADHMQVSALFPPSASSANGVCNNFASGNTTAYLIHCGEGVDASSVAELATLGTVTTPDNCLYAPKTTLVHATAFGDAQLSIMAQHGMSIGWSARVNVFLYGGGTDLTKNPNIPLALSKGINVALGPDWSIGGSQNLLDEMRYADMIDNTIWGNQITPKMLLQMATKNGAKALGLDAVLGSLEVGKKADLFVIGGDAANPYDAVLAATPVDVRLVMVGGVALYGDSSLAALGPPSPGCEALDICCHSKFACVAAPSNSSSDKFDQTYAEIEGALSQGLANYDALGLSPWTFSPITPLVRCP